MGPTSGRAPGKPALPVELQYGITPNRKAGSMRRTNVTKQRMEQTLALQGGMKAVGRIEGKGKPKIGTEEFLALAKRFGYSPGTLKAIRRAVVAEGMTSGPFLGNYYADLPETCVQGFERTAREAFGVRYAVGVSSGTAALHAAFVAVGVGPGTGGHLSGDRLHGHRCSGDRRPWRTGVL